MNLILIVCVIAVVLIWSWIYLPKKKEGYTGNLRVATELDRKKAMKYALRTLCEKGGYAWYESPEDQFIYDCKHTKETCNKESVYPTKEGKSPKYYEWRDISSPDGQIISNRIPPTVQSQNGFCILGNESFRKTCEDEYLNYNKGDGTCKTTKPYCNSKLLAYCNGDCFESPDTMILSRLFGNTLSRPLTQTLTELINVSCPK